MDTTELLALIAWIGLEVGYDVAAVPPPRVVQMTPAEITAEYYADAPHAAPDSGVDPRVNALYASGDGPGGTIYVLAPRFVDDRLSEGERNPAWREMLVRELVHHIQWNTGANEAWPCPRAGEPEAYRVAERWLRSVRADDPLPNRAFWGAVYGRC